MKTQQLLSTLVVLLTTIQLSTAQGIALERATFTYEVTGALSVSLMADAYNMNVNSFIWDFGDDSILSGDMNNNYPTHTYKEAGTYTVCLTLIDVDLAKETSCQTIIVEDAFQFNNSTIKESDVNFTFSDADTGDITFTPTFANDPNLLYFWDFGDGNTSLEYKPFHPYKYYGSYIVKLSVRDTAYDRVYAKEKRIVIQGSSYVSDFVYAQNGKSFQFLNQSTAGLTKFYWSLGDGTIKQGKDINHTYAEDGLYSVVLVGWDGGTFMDYVVKQVRVGNVRCNSKFSYYVDSTSNTVFFKNNALGVATRYHWVMGDGTVYNTPDPIHRFKRDGFYGVSLTTFNLTNRCVDHHKEKILIGSKGNDILVDFEVLNPMNIVFNLVNFMNKTIGDYDSLAWNFGKGEEVVRWNDTLSFIQHTFNSLGHKDICLTIFYGDSLQKTVCKPIQLSPPTGKHCKANFVFAVPGDSTRVRCTDRSIGENLSYEWEYDGMVKSTLRNPVFDFADKGYHRVSLKVSDTEGCESKTYRLIRVGLNDSTIKAGFGLDVQDTITLKATGYPIDFVAISHGDAAKLKWSFGDGNYDSTTTNPTHIYEAKGNYTACLEIWDLLSGDYDEYCEDVNVQDPLSGEALSSSGNISVNLYPNPASVYTQIAYELTTAENVSISLLSIDGREVQQIIAGPKGAGIHNVVVNVAELNAGAYFVKVVIGDKTIMKPLIKQ